MGIVLSAICHVMGVRKGKGWDDARLMALPCHKD